MASKNSRKVKKALKKVHTAYIVIAVIALAIGLAVGYFGASFLYSGDVLEVKGNKITEVADGKSVSYKDEGIKYISSGKDLSDKYEITTNMMLENGAYVGTPSEDTELFIIYTVTEGRAAGQTVYRVWRVADAGGNA